MRVSFAKPLRRETMRVRKMGLVFCCFLIVFSMLSCQQKKPTETESGQKQKRVAFVICTLRSPWFVAVANMVKQQSEANGWICEILDANTDLLKEAELMDSVISRKVDLIFLDAVDPDGSIVKLNEAYAAGIPVINIDRDFISPAAKYSTTVISDNKGNGFAVGRAYVNDFWGMEKPIKAVLISGNMGNLPSLDRRTGFFAGVISARTGVSDDRAWSESLAFNERLTNGGRAEHAGAGFVVAGQGWGDWAEDGGLNAAQDLIAANRDLTVMVAENDDMLLGARRALINAGLADVDMVACADGSKTAYDLMRQPGSKYLLTGENSAIKVGSRAVEIAKEILVNGRDPYSFEKNMKTDPFAVSLKNLNQHYDYGF
jgi:ribose transport system substrate-binding protein